MRLDKHCSQKLFDARFADGPRSPVLYLNAIRESELLVSQLNGDVSSYLRLYSFLTNKKLCRIQLVTFDLRFSSIASPPSPVRLFENHINSYTDNLVRPLINADVFLQNQHSNNNAVLHRVLQSTMIKTSFSRQVKIVVSELGHCVRQLHCYLL